MTDVLEQLRAALAGRYTIDRKIGQGGMATLYLAQDERHQRDVAIKVLRPDLARPILGKRGHTLVVDDRIYHGTAERMEYEVWSAGGDLETIVRVSGYDLTLSAEEILLEREARLPANAPARFRQLQASLPDPESRPAYSKLLVSTDGHVWLAEDNGFAGRYDPTDWEVFAPDGVWLGSVRTPERFTAFRFNDDIVLGVWLDELDVEHVQLLELVRH